MKDQEGTAPPKVAPTQINPEDIATQVAVLLTKQGGTAVVFPQTPGGTPDMPLALELMAQGLHILADILRQQAPQDARRIVVVPNVPPGVDLRREVGK